MNAETLKNSIIAKVIGIHDELTKKPDETVIRVYDKETQALVKTIHITRKQTEDE